MLDKLPRVENAKASPCWQQKQIAAQNSYLATIKSGREMVYVAPCAASPQPLERTIPMAPPPRVSALTPPEPVEPIDPLTVVGG